MSAAGAGVAGGAAQSGAPLDRLICVAADPDAHNEVDRSVAGRRVLCPRFATITCEEHRRAYDQLLPRWPALRRAGEADEPPDGDLLLAPDGTRHELAELETLEKLDGAAATDDELAAPIGDLLWNEGPAQLDAAQRLVASPSTRARAAIEALLGVGDAAALPIAGGDAHELVVPTSATLALLDAMARRLAPEDVRLIAALAASRADPGVAALALTRLPPGADVAGAEHALQWSDDARLRAAAKEALLRLDPSVERRGWIELVEAAAALPR